MGAGEAGDDAVSLAAPLARQGTPPSEGGRGGGDSAVDAAVVESRGRRTHKKRLIPVRDQLSDGARRTKAWLEGSAVALFGPIGFTADKITLTPPAHGYRAADGGNRYDCARALRAAQAAANARMRARVTVPTAPANANRAGLQSREMLLVLAESLAWFRDGDGRTVFANDDNAIRQLQERGLVCQPTPRFHAYEPPGPISSASYAATDDVRIPASPASFSTQGFRSWGAACQAGAAARRAFVERVERDWTFGDDSYSALAKWSREARERAWGGLARNERAAILAKFSACMAVYWALEHPSEIPGGDFSWNMLQSVGGNLLRAEMERRKASGDHRADRYGIVADHVKGK